MFNRANQFHWFFQLHYCTNSWLEGSYLQPSTDFGYSLPLRMSEGFSKTRPDTSHFGNFTVVGKASHLANWFPHMSNGCNKNETWFWLYSNRLWNRWTLKSHGLLLVPWKLPWIGASTEFHRCWANPYYTVAWIYSNMYIFCWAYAANPKSG